MEKKLTALEKYRNGKKDYKYEPRANMPFWFDFEPNKFKEMLDQDSNMSIDDDWDPEANIYVKFFEEISRLLDFKDLLYRYMNLCPNSLKRKDETLAAF